MRSRILFVLAVVFFAAGAYLGVHPRHFIAAFFGFALGAASLIRAIAVLGDADRRENPHIQHGF